MNVKAKIIALVIAVSLVTGTAGLALGLMISGDNQPNIPFTDGTGKTNDDEQDGNGKITEEQISEVEKIARVFQMISDRYVLEVSKDDLIEGAIQGMVDKLDDPYTSYMDEDEAAQFVESLSSSFEGIGAEVSMVNGKIKIVLPFKGSPAEKAGLKPGDQIVSIDGESVEGLSLTEAVLKIRGKKGTDVKLGIVRQGVKDPISIVVTRDTIPLITVNASSVEKNGKKVGILEITSFSANTAAEFKKELKKLEDEGITGLIIDVRGNPGGYLNAVKEMLYELIPSDKPIFQIETRDGERDQAFTTLKDKKPYPIIGLIDGRSASASEILAGALKEAGGYEIIGQNSFGKGTVQQALEVGDGSQLKMTLYKWLTPDGNWIHKTGIEPTIEVKQPEFFQTSRIFIEEKLTYDMYNDQVKSAQEMLKGLGFDPGRTDGYFSEKTVLAVKAFQEMNNLEPTGDITVATAGVLEEEIIERIRNPQYDYQLQAAIQLITK
ncbi:peptidase S41 [Lottiidibacillus patelloidae]|uniref:Peptidase S41 n=1 Tax=Lottiidibacillus patelloidae TaxID=2670334 RepID=A0A263BT32_9BACI|nr:S41 family peptidase [Lottiidibacillus patelloidae]OZM56527.1 peptidase S41 [Lottiidibacillus patelloidae]